MLGNENVPSSSRKVGEAAKKPEEEYMDHQLDTEVQTLKAQIHQLQQQVSVLSVGWEIRYSPESRWSDAATRYRQGVSGRNSEGFSVIGVGKGGT